jgi:hypothetical protein
MDNMNSAQAFQAGFGTHSSPLVFSNCGNCSGFGINAGIRDIRFRDFYSNSRKNIKFIIHELGHAFNNSVADFLGYNNDQINNDGTPYAALKEEWKTTAYLERKNYGNTDNFYHGFAGGWEDWQFAKYNKNTNGEIWADMFLGWVYNQWGNNQQGADRSNLMNNLMDHYSHMLSSP